jgi:hypothetical protein
LGYIFGYTRRSDELAISSPFRGALGFAPSAGELTQYQLDLFET